MSILETNNAQTRSLIVEADRLLKIKSVEYTEVHLASKNTHSLSYISEIVEAVKDNIRVLRKVQLYFKAINASLFHTTGKLSYGRVTEAITKLAELAHKYKTPDGMESYELWSIGEHESASLDNLIVGAYWFYSNYRAGQSSPEYSCLSSLGNVFSPGMSSLEYDSSEQDVHNSIKEIYEREQD